MRIERVWAMPNRWTFTIPPIAQLIKEEMADTRPWLDPFAGMHSPAHVRNDLNPECNVEYHMDAIDFLQSMDGQKFVGAFFDPPYSFTKAVQCYEHYGKGLMPNNLTNQNYWAQVKSHIRDLIVGGGKVISCGWNSNGIGMNRGFQLDRVLLVAHGSGRNDTIVTVETKVQATLEEATRPEPSATSTDRGEPEVIP